MNPVLINLQNIYFSYADLMVLENINLTIKTGDFLGLVGPNGGGKSTLLKILLGLLTANSGSIDKKKQLTIGYVPQFSTFVKDFPINVKETVLLGRFNQSWFHYYSKHDHAIAQSCLQEMSIWSLRNKQLNQLSGGQLQRVLIARALACQPELLILDEPTANIDLRAEEDIFDLLKQLSQRMTIIVVSHDIGFISKYITQVACLNRTLMYHATTAITAELIQQLYAHPVNMIQHQH